jgi:hypothetical protein
MSQYIYSRRYRQRIFAGLLAAFVLLAGAYAYFLQQTVQHVVERKSLNTEISALHSQIGDAEFTYGSSVSGVTIDKALALGFQEVDDSTYVTRADRGTLVSINVSEQ